MLFFPLGLIENDRYNPWLGESGESGGEQNADGI